MTQKHDIQKTSSHVCIANTAIHFSSYIILALYVTLFIVTLTLPTLTHANTQNTVTGYTIKENNDDVQFIINFLQEPEYKIFLMHNPERIVIDLHNTTLGKPDILLSKNKLITSIRHDKKANNTLRIVLDISQQFSIKNYFTLPPRKNLQRLLIDIAPENTTKGNNINTNIVPAPTPILKKSKKPLIAIDAGHGGHDPGTTGYRGTKEKNVTLSFAHTLKKALEKTGRYKVFLTRKNDKYISLKNRVKLSRNSKADMFISIHADAHKNRGIKGLSVYTLSERASDKEAEALAHKENNAGILDDIDIDDNSIDVTALMIDLVQRETKNLSADFAEDIISEAKTTTSVLKRTPHRFAGFRVLTAADIPSVLIELGYLSNRKEEKLLKSTKHKKKLAEAIVRAIDKHFRKYSVD